jgi:hypothetical protein
MEVERETNHLWNTKTGDIVHVPRPDIPEDGWVAELRDFQERTKQLGAVRAHLERYGVLTKHQAVYEGIEGYGIIGHPGARIFDLRQDGFEIKTEAAPTAWRLISKPKVRQLTITNVGSGL